MIIINAKIKVDENKREDYLQLMADLVEHSRQEKGNLFYHHYEDVSEANTFVVVENYKDKNAVEEHNQSEHFQTFSQNISKFITEEPKIDESRTVEK